MNQICLRGSTKLKARNAFTLGILPYFGADRNCLNCWQIFRSFTLDFSLESFGLVPNCLGCGYKGHIRSRQREKPLWPVLTQASRID
jgi:hypothetical protein